MMVVMMVMAPRCLSPTFSSSGCLCKILKIRKRPVLGCGGEVRRQLRQLIGRVRVSVGLGGLRGSGQVRGDGLRDLLVLCWVRLLKLLQRAGDLGERRKLAVV